MTKYTFVFVALVLILLPFFGLKEINKDKGESVPDETQNTTQPKPALNDTSTSISKQHQSSVKASNGLNTTEHTDNSELPQRSDFLDFTQTHIRGVGTGNGQQYCAPVAVANSLHHLSQANDNPEALILKLASKDYMNTSLKNGTGVKGVMRGVDKLAKEMFGGYRSLSYEGWRPHPKKFAKHANVPVELHVNTAISDKSAAWLNVGWYRYDAQKDEYQRFGGHWVTLVGSVRQHGNNLLLIHDPAPRAGDEPLTQYVDYSIIEGGTLMGDKKGLPHQATGFISLEDGFIKKSSADFAIVDGVVYLDI